MSQLRVKTCDLFLLRYTRQCVANYINLENFLSCWKAPYPPKSVSGLNFIYDITVESYTGHCTGRGIYVNADVTANVR